MIYDRCVNYLMLSLFALMTFGDIGINSVRAESVNLFEQQKIMSHLLVNAFLEKVGKEDLSIFGHAIKKADLVPHHVSYVHDLGGDDLKAELCFRLTKQIPVPDLDGYYVEKIIVEMANDGTITEVSTHVSPVEQEPEEKTDQGKISQ